MSDKDSKLLNLYFDDELPSESREQFRKEVLENKQEDYSSLLKLRGELRKHFDADIDFSEDRSDALWSKIENDIKQPSKDYKVNKKPWYYIPLQGYAFAAVCSFVAFSLGAQMFADTNVNSNSSFAQVASKTIAIEEPIGQASLKQAGLAVNSRPASRALVRQQDVHQVANYKRQSRKVFNSLPIELDTEQLIGFSDDDKVVAMRSNGLDIDWMKSDKNYKLVESPVPVIWVSD